MLYLICKLPICVVHLYRMTIVIDKGRVQLKMDNTSMNFSLACSLSSMWRSGCHFRACFIISKLEGRDTGRKTCQFFVCDSDVVLGSSVGQAQHSIAFVPSTGRRHSAVVAFKLASSWRGATQRMEAAFVRGRKKNNKVTAIGFGDQAIHPLIYVYKYGKTRQMRRY